jgi:acyl-homoserine lactone synthase
MQPSCIRCVPLYSAPSILPTRVPPESHIFKSRVLRRSKTDNPIRNILMDMNLLILAGADLRQQPFLQSQVYRLRHQVFVEKLGWEAIRRPDGLETDAFDTDDAMHFLLLSSHGTLAAYSRLLPTTQPHLLTSIYPHLLGASAAPPIDDDVWEWTRCTTIPVPTTQKNKHHDVAGLGFAINPAGRKLVLGIVEWALARGVVTLSLQCDPGFAVILEALGARAEVLAETSLTAEGARVAPILMHLSQKTKQTMANLFKMDGRSSGEVGKVAESSML